MSNINDPNEDVAIYVDISRVRPNPNKPRIQLDEDTLQELSDSIKTYGMLVPLIVVDMGDYYEILVGERRWLAAQMAGLKEVPVIIREDLEGEIVDY